MRILIVCQYFPPDITAAAFRMFDTARLLEEGEHEVRVITAYPHRSQAAGDSIAEYDRQISSVRRTRVVRLTGGGLLRYIRHYGSFMTGSVRLGLRQRLSGWKPEVIWASSPPLFVGLSGVALSRLFRVPLVLDIRDIWPASAVGAGQLSPHGRAYRYGEKMEKYVYDKATHITCVACSMREYIRTRTETPVTVVYNGTRVSDIVDESVGNGMEGGRTLLYAGNFGRAQQLDLLIGAWANVRSGNEHPGWTLKLLGTGVMERQLRELALSLGLNGNITFAPCVSRQDAMCEMTRAAALCVCLQADQAFERTIPSKVFDCMAAGRPILAGVGGEARDILQSTEGNVCYQPGNQHDLERCLVRLMRDYSLLRAMARRNPQVVRSRYSRETAVAVLMQVFDSVVLNARRVPAAQASRG